MAKPSRSRIDAEYRSRFEKNSDHKSISILKGISNCHCDDRGLTEFAQAVPNEYKIAGDVVKAYRQFYLGEKMTFSRCTKRNVPEWALQS